MQNGISPLRKKNADAPDGWRKNRIGCKPLGGRMFVPWDVVAVFECAKTTTHNPEYKP